MSVEEDHTIPRVQQAQAVPEHRENLFHNPIYELEQIKKEKERKERQRKKAPRKIRRARDSKRGLLIDLEA